MYRYALRRVGFAALSAVLVVSATFLVVRVAPNTALGGTLSWLKLGGPEAQEFVQQYREKRGLTGSLLDQYLRFMWGAVRLDFGYSYSLRKPIAPVMWRAVPRTLGYVIPGVLLAYVVGIAASLLGVYGSRAWDTATRAAVYVGLGVPTMVLGVVTAYSLAPHYDWLADPLWCVHGGFGIRCTLPFMVRGSPNMSGTRPWLDVSAKYALPAAVLAVGVVAALFRHTRNAALEYRRSQHSKMLRAKGAGDAVDARHALRNAALPLLSVSFAELMSVLALGSFVIESIFHIPGVAAYTMIAVYTRDFALLTATAVVFALVGATGSLIQDLLHAFLDPRTGE